MTTPQITTAPNQENTDFIRTADNKAIKRHLFGKRTPETHETVVVTFNNLIKTRTIQQEIQEENRHGNPIAKTLHKAFNSTLLAQIFTFLGLAIVFLAHIKVLAFIIPAIERSFLFLILVPLAITAITVYVMMYIASLGIYVCDQIKHRDTLPYLTMDQKTRLKDISVAYMDNENLSPCDVSVYRVKHVAESMLQLREENPEYNIDMSRFAQAYDDYTKVLLFVYANKDSISKDLLAKYVKELNSLTEIVVEEGRSVRSEVEEIKQAVATELESSKDFEKELAAIRQEEVDTAATAAMPLRFQ